MRLFKLRHDGPPTHVAVVLAVDPDHARREAQKWAENEEAVTDAARGAYSGWLREAEIIEYPITSPAVVAWAEGWP